MELLSTRGVTCFEWQEGGIYEICFTLWPDRLTAEKPKSRGCAWGGEDKRLGAGLMEDAGVLAESYDIVPGKLARLLLRVHKAQRLRVFRHLHRLLLPVYNLEANHERE